MLLKLWKLRLWVGIGILLGVAAAAATVKVSRPTVYASASTQMLVDSPSSALANSRTDLTGYISRANVFANLMTSAEALNYIGKAAGVPGNLIAPTGPIGVTGAPSASHAPVETPGTKAPPGPYKLSFVQD